MRASQRYSVTLPAEMAEAIEKKVKSGEYASVDEVIHDGVQTLLEQDEGLEAWLGDEVTKSHDEYLADPSRTVPIEQVMERIQARYRARQKKAG